MNTKLLLYYTLIYPYLIYCNIIWASTYPSNLTRLLLMQKRAVRAITNAYYRAHTKPLFLQLGMLDIYQINTFYTPNFMFLYHSHSLSSSLNTLFITGNQIHIYDARHAFDYRTHACRASAKQFIILFRGPKLWNSLPKGIVNQETSSCFRNRMIKFLLEKSS